MAPTGHGFSTEAVLAALLTPESSANPTRLTVKLPVTDLGGARRTLAKLAPDWQLDEAEIAAWAARAAMVTTTSHAYSTRVFAAQPTGFVRFELQVEHHVEQDQYVLDALFSWDRRPPKFRRFDKRKPRLIVNLESDSVSKKELAS